MMKKQPAMPSGGGSASRGERLLWPVLCAGLTLLALVLLFPLNGRLMPCSAGIFGTECLLSGAHFFLVGRQKREILRLCGDLDAVLHGSLDSIGNFEEGELSILKNEISKLLLRLREIMDLLQKEKNALADSMADLSHQLRTPLTSVRLIATMLSKPGLAEKRRMDLAVELRQILSGTEWLLEALLKLSRIDAGMVKFAKTRFSATELVQKASSPLLTQLELRGLNLETVLPGGECFLEADLLWTVEALSNILKNGMEHTPPGGKITLTAEENPLYTELRIEDTGDGFSPEDLPHIFERYYKGKSEREIGSFGIGLSLCRRILTEQNATVKAENRREGGARFILKFYKSVF